MDDEQLAGWQLERNDLEWNTVLVGPKEEDAVWLAQCRRPGVDGVWAVLDDMHGAGDVDAVVPRRWREADRQVTSSFCRTQQESSTVVEEHERSLLTSTYSGLIGFRLGLR